jgi:integration host factor subunit beta
LSGGPRAAGGDTGGLGMTKAELVEEVARVSELTKKHSEIIVNTVFDSIITALQKDEKIELRGFGSFRIRQRRSRQGRNPKTGDKVDVPAKRIPYFKPGKELKELINTAHGGLAGATVSSTPTSGLDR